jgi:hypothetical protein
MYVSSVFRLFISPDFEATNIYESSPFSALQIYENMARLRRKIMRVLLDF